MHRLSNGTQVSAIPSPAPVIGAPGYASSGIVGVQDPSVIDPDSFNTHQEELMAFLDAANIIPDKTKNSQVLAAVKYIIAQSIEGKQDSLGFIPVKQGTGPSQLSKPIVALGQDSDDASRLRYSLDETDGGLIATTKDVSAMNAVPYASHVIVTPQAGQNIEIARDLSCSKPSVIIVGGTLNIAGSVLQPDKCSLSLLIDDAFALGDVSEQPMSLTWSAQLSAGNHTIKLVYTPNAGGSTFFNIGMALSVVQLPAFEE